MNKNISLGNTYKIIIFSIAYGIGFFYLKTFSKQNSWLIIIISNFLGFLFIKMISTIKKYSKNKTIYETNKIILGKIPGTIVNIIFIIVFILFSSISLWYLVIFLKTNFLNKTSSLIIEMALIIPLFYISNKDSSIIVKSSYIFSFIIFVLTIISIIFLMPQIEINNLKPFIEVSKKDMINAIFSFTAVTYLPTYAISGLKNQNNSHLFKYSIRTLLLIISIVLSTYLVLGNSIVEIVDFPEFFVLRKIGFLANGTRIDSLIIIGWILSIYILNSTLILYIRNYLNYELKKYKNNYIYLIIVIISILSLNLFKNVTVGKIFILNKLPYLLFSTIFILNLVIYSIIKVKHKNVSHKY